jgi:exoribonuclease II
LYCSGARAFLFAVLWYNGLSGAVMKENDFVFTVGYQGESAIVDSKAQKKYKSASIDQLLEEGMFKAAFCKAIYNEDTEGQEKVLRAYNEKSGSSYASIENLKRLFGVFGVPEEVNKITTI